MWIFITLKEYFLYSEVALYTLCYCIKLNTLKLRFRVYLDKLLTSSKDIDYKEIYFEYYE